MLIPSAAKFGCSPWLFGGEESRKVGQGRKTHLVLCKMAPESDFGGLLNYG